MSKAATKEHDCKLRRQLQHLQDDWDSYKQSIPRRRRMRCTSTVLAAALELLSNSPKKLMCSLQRAQTQAADCCSSPEEDDQECEEVEKVVNDPASRSGELRRGRRLLEALEDAKDEVCGYAREEACSVSSSVLIQGAEATSSCNSCGCPLMVDKHVKVTYLSSPMSDPSYSSSTPDNVDQLDSNMQKGGGGDGGGGVKRGMSLVLFPIVIVTLAFVFMMVKGFTMEEAYECCIVPT